MNSYGFGSNFTSPCSGGHRFTYAGDPYDGMFPEGYPCECGKTVLHYTTCKACGVTHTESIPNPANFKGFDNVLPTVRAGS
jgi:hypothetical protein